MHDAKYSPKDFFEKQPKLWQGYHNLEVSRSFQLVEIFGASVQFVAETFT
jgi:hypothetical protein